MKHLLDLGVWAQGSELSRCDEKKEFKPAGGCWRSGGSKAILRKRKCSWSATEGIVTDLELCLLHLVPAVIAVLRPDMVGAEVIIPWALLFGEAR